MEVLQATTFQGRDDALSSDSTVEPIRQPLSGVVTSIRSGARRNALALMRAHGLRVSAARRLVVEALLVAEGPMSAEQIAQGIGGQVPSSDQASVYRNLERLEEIGLVRHVHLGHGPRLYALAVEGELEYLTCERCADFVMVDSRAFDAVRGVIEREFGYRATFSHFPIVGLCASCQEELAAAESAPA